MSRARPVGRERDEETGKYETVYSSEEILDLLAGTRLSTSEVAEELDCHRTTAHERLIQLEDDKKIKSKKVGNTLLWEVN